MKTTITITLLFLLSLIIASCGVMNSKKAEPAVGHATLTEQHKLIACSDCHKDATPDIHREWYSSTHGLGGVKCYQCHNSFENLVRSPDIHQSCNSCHADKVNNEEHTEGEDTCWECHQGHSFVAP